MTENSRDKDAAHRIIVPNTGSEFESRMPITSIREFALAGTSAEALRLFRDPFPGGGGMETGLRVSEGRQQRQRKRRIFGTPPPWLRAYVLINADSYNLLNDYFLRKIIELDEAGGDNIRLIYIGDSEQSGAIYKSRRTEVQRERDAQAAEHWAKHIFPTGRERYTRLGELRDLQEIVHLSPSDLPCILFGSPLDENLACKLHMQASWVASPDSIKVLDRHLQTWLTEKHLQELVATGWDRTFVSVELDKMIDELAKGIDHEIDQRYRTNTDRSVPIAQRGTIPTAPGTTWGNVKIVIRNGETASIVVGNETKEFGYSDMGMIDTRTRQPNKQWQLLCLFAQRNSSIDWNTPEAQARIKKKKSLLCKALKECFHQLDGDPISWDKGSKSYKCRFHVSAMTDSSVF